MDLYVFMRSAHFPVMVMFKSWVRGEPCFTLKIVHFHTNHIVQIHAKLPPGKIVTFSCEIGLIQSYAIQSFWKRSHLCILDTEKERTRKKEGTNEWMNDRDRVSETESGCDCTKQSHSVWGSSKILKEIHCVSSGSALTEIKLCPETFLYSSTRSETILPVAQNRLSSHRSLSLCKNRSHRLIPRWL